MDSGDLRFFLAVAEEGHFTRAAERLLVAQPAVSQRVRGLERSLGLRLFDRTSRSVQLTEAGQTLLALARPIINQLDDIEAHMRAFRGEVEQEVTVATMKSLPGVQLSSLLGAFRLRHPNVRLVLRELTTSTMLTQLADGDIDLAIVQRSSRPPAGIVFEELSRDSFVLITPAGHRMAERRRVSMSELAGESFVSLERGSGVEQTLRTAAEKAGFEPRVAVEVLQLDTVRELVSAGLGVALVPKSRAEIDGAPVAVVNVGPPALVRRIVIAGRRDGLKPGARAFQEVVKNAFARAQTAKGA